MRKAGLFGIATALAVGLAGFSTPSRADTGAVAVIFTKGGFIVGVGGGEGVLTYRGKHYPFTVSGMSVGFTIGASTTKLTGRALNLNGPQSLEGSYAAGGAGAQGFPCEGGVPPSRILQAPGARRQRANRPASASAWRTDGAIRRAIGLRSLPDRPMIRPVRNLRVRRTTPHCADRAN